MMKIATILHNENNTRLGIYFANNTLYTKENTGYVAIPETEGYTTSVNYADVCRSIWGQVWDLRFEEIRQDDKKQPKQVFSIRLDNETVEQIKGIATEGNVGQWIRLLVERELEEINKSKPQSLERE